MVLNGDYIHLNLTLYLELCFSHFYKVIILWKWDKTSSTYSTNEMFCFLLERLCRLVHFHTWLYYKNMTRLFGHTIQILTFCRTKSLVHFYTSWSCSTLMISWIGISGRVSRLAAILTKVGYWSLLNEWHVGWGKRNF